MKLKVHPSLDTELTMEKPSWFESTVQETKLTRGTSWVEPPPPRPQMILNFMGLYQNYSQ